MNSPRFSSHRLLIVDGLTIVARESALKLNRFLAEKSRRRYGGTLRPGPHTPLWNAYLASAKPFLQRHGEKARLARLIGVPRQRISDYLNGRGRMPDAERTLLLLDWLAARQRGSNPG